MGVGKLSAVITLVATIVVGSYAIDQVYVRQIEHDNLVAQAEEMEQDLLNYMQQAERRSIRRAIRKLESTEDMRELTGLEKDDLRELKDQLEEIK
jgi:uncharacterized damage-inducible protein DinB